MKKLILITSLSILTLSLILSIFTYQTSSQQTIPASSLQSVSIGSATININNQTVKAATTSAHSLTLYKESNINSIQVTQSTNFFGHTKYKVTNTYTSFPYTITSINQTSDTTEYYATNQDGTGIFFTSSDLPSNLSLSVNDSITAFFDPSDTVEGLISIEKN